MGITTIYYDAKCKHCRFFEYKNIPNKYGDRSKVNRAFCTNPLSKYFKEQLTINPQRKPTYFSRWMNLVNNFV